MKETKIQWTDHTFNPHWGCARVSPGCENCYAEAFAKRTGHKVWGANADRREFGDKHWAEPLKWNRDAEKAGVRRRVFCASMADVFEDHPVAQRSRERLWPLIEQTPHLDWQLLTKRPDAIAGYLPQTWGAGWPNVWLGTTVEDQKRADERIAPLLRVPAAVRFLSCEPLLGPVDLCRTRFDEANPSFDMLRFGFWDTPYGFANCSEAHRRFGRPIDWVIVGGESGPRARRFDAEWARAIVTQCRDAGVAVFVKQMGAHVVDRNDRFDLCDDTGSPDDWWPWGRHEPDDIEENINGYREEYQGAPVRLRLIDSRKGADPSEWPRDLRVREMPRPL